MCLCVCVCVEFRPDSHILVISQGILTSACDHGAAVTYTLGQRGANMRSVMRAEHKQHMTNRTNGGPNHGASSVLRLD